MIPYAPLLDSTVPAFALDAAGLPDQIKVNFTHNNAVSISDLWGFRIIFKSLNNYTTNTILVSGYRHYTDEGIKDAVEKGLITFGSGGFKDEDKNKLIAGSYYKVQIAYIQKDPIDPTKSGVTGAYSTIGIIRCIGDIPQLTIAGLSKSKSNSDTGVYTGSYTNKLVASEIVYKYRFLLQQPVSANSSKYKTMETSGWIIPAGEPMVFSHRQKLKTDGTIYKIKLSIITVNGYEQSVTYDITGVGTYPVKCQGLYLVADGDLAEAREHGYIKVTLNEQKNKDGSNATSVSVGNFKLLRAKEGSNVWDELADFSTTAKSDLSKFVWQDFTVEHGVGYVYAIRRYTIENKVYKWSDWVKSTDPIPGTGNVDTRAAARVFFEHMFLGDGERQLCIMFNPKVSSFKETILESKMDTIGGKYPYFFRNGQVRYKEIGISGLLSYWLDPNHYFMTQQELGFVDQNPKRKKTDAGSSAGKDYRSFGLTDTNFMAERQFKLTALEWLNNGKPKLFRSPAEGNYVVRLMNSSLSPNDQLSRMLHTFTSTAYEAMDMDSVENLIEKDIASFPKYSGEEQAVKKTTTVHVLGQNSVVMATPSLSSRTRSEAAVQYAKIPINRNTVRFEFIARPGVDISPSVYVDTDGSVLLTDEGNGVYSLPRSAISNMAKYLGISIDDFIEVYQREEFVNSGYDDYAHMVRSANQYLFSIPMNQTCATQETDLLFEQEIERLYTLTITPEGEQLTEDNAFVYIEYKDATCETIYVTDGETRILHNLDSIVTIEKGSAVHLDIYALIAPKISSLLGEFILNESVLGG